MRPGRDFLPVLVSIDPRESPAEAAAKQAALLARLRLQGHPEAFPFLVGSRDQVQQLAGGLGFKYAWDARSEQYAHPAVVFVLTPELRVSRYLHGVQYPPDVLEHALREAAQGRLDDASRAEPSVLLRCFRFMTGSQRYASEIQRYFQLAGALILLAVMGLLGGLLRRERRRAP
jgi:protein SCO1/2